MCTTCGCTPTDHHHHDHDHHHGHHDHHKGHHTHHHHHGDGHHDRERRSVSVETAVLEKNDRLAAANREILRSKGVLALNLVSSPGSGKTTLLERTLTDCAGRFRSAVIEGDQQTDNDARRIAATGVPVKQINTGAGCHLDAHMVAHALEGFDLDRLDLLFIENVGNLVCPAAFDLGEDAKVVVLSVTEGEDKPLKYPQMFHNSRLMLLNKIDLLPHLSFDVDRCVEYARRVNPSIEVIRTSALTGEGMEEWYAWCDTRRRRVTAP